MKAHRFQNQRGVALILTLTILAIVLIMLIAFITSMRTERIAAKGYTDYVKAKLLADAAVDEAVSALLLGTPLQTNNPPTTFWTAPGLALTNQNGVFGSVPLYSIYNYASDTNYVNLNATNNPITGVNSIMSANNGIYVQWVNVGTNGLAPTAGNPIVGRFAYWVDDEATKVNINSAWARDPSITQTNNSLLAEVDLEALLPPLNNASVADAVLSNRIFHTYNTPDEIRRATNTLNTLVIDSLGYASNQFNVTTYSVDANTDTWGRPRVDLNSIPGPTTGDAYDRMTNDFYQNVYPFLNPNTNTFAKKYGPVNIKQILANIIDYTKNGDADATYDALDGTLEIPQTYCGLKKGPYLNEIILHAMQTNALSSITTNTGTPDIYITNWNVTVSVFADVELINPFPNPRGTGWEILVEPQSISYSVGSGAQGAQNNGNGTTWSNFYPTAVSGASAVTWPLAGFTNQTRTLQEDTPGFGYRTLSQPNASAFASSWTNTAVWQNTSAFSGNGTLASEVPSAIDIAVQLKRVLLRRTPGGLSSIRDWATSVGPAGGFADLTSVTIPQALLWYIRTNSVTAPIRDWMVASTSGVNYDKNSVGFAKNDPRMRTFVNMAPAPAWTNWLPTSGIATLRATPTASNAGSITDHKTQAYVSFIPDGSEGGTLQQDIEQSTFYIKEAPFESPGELGFIHTGYPWRTLRMQSVVPPTNSVVAACSSCTPKVRLDPLMEATRIPDWLLLDMFTAGTTPEMKGRLNINATLFGSNDFPRPTAVGANVPHPRSPSLAALTYGMDTVPLTTTNNNSVPGTTNNWWGTYTNPATFIPSFGSPQPASIDVRPGTNAMFIAWGRDTNMLPQVHVTFFVTNALARYDANTLFLTPGEVLEVTGMDNALVQYLGNGARKADKELMARKIANLITTRSNAFTIWAYAQTLNVPTGTTTTNVTSEVKVQAVVERYVQPPPPTAPLGTPPTVQFRTKYYRYIYE